METREYQEKMKEMLNDEATYEKLKKDPTKKYKAELIRMVNSLVKEGKITKDQYWYLYPTLEKVPRMYGSPKIHKEGVPLRPIVDYTQTIAYRVSRELANILQPLVGKTEHHTENSQELVKEMTKLRVEEGESFVSYDVVSLFTKTPIKETCEIIRKRLENDKTLKKRTNVNVDDIMELLIFVLETTYFRFEGEIYQQKFTSRNLPAEIWSSHGKSGISHCCQLVHGGPGAENNSNSTGRLPTEKLETICGRCNLPGTHGKGKEITTTHEHCRPHREHHFHAGR